MHFRLSAVAGIAGVLMSAMAWGQADTPRPEQNFGLALSYSVFASTAGSKRSTLATKGITIRTGPEACVCFDTDTLRMAGAWTGGFLDLSHSHFTQLKGSLPGIVPGVLKIHAPEGPGWSLDGRFDDPRVDHLGPLPRESAHYSGYYLHGDQVVLSYSVGPHQVLELPGSITRQGSTLFVRTMKITPQGPARELCAMLLAGQARLENGIAWVRNGDTAVAVVLIDGPAGAKLQSTDKGVILRLPLLERVARIRVGLWAGLAGDAQVVSSLVKQAPVPPDLAVLCKGGPAHWKEPIVLRGVRGRQGAAYTVDTLTIPESNPWNSWMRLSGLDFFSDGRIAVCTMGGDVWIVSGVDDKLEKLSWKRYAAGLYEPLGLKVVNDQVYVLGRDQITRLHDLNADGEADFYENFNNDAVADPIYHAFALDLQTDSQGNFYYARGGNQVRPGLRDHSVMARISRDGQRYEVYATGFRAPNGMAIGPGDEIVCSDNQGEWMPSNKISLVERGRYYGFPGDPKHLSKSAPYPPELTQGFTPPILWIPMHLDNSSGGQVFCTGDRWGPFGGQLLHTSYGKASLFVVMRQNVDGMVQGALTRFPLEFDSGIMRARFSPIDGQLYVCGLKGWQTSGSRDGTLARVRYTGKTLYMPVAFHAEKGGVKITFACALDAKSAADVQNYDLEMWNYQWGAHYGSKDYSVLEPGRTGRDALDVKAATVEGDGRTILLEVPELRPCMQFRIKYKIKALDGTVLSSEIDATIHALK